MGNLEQPNLHVFGLREEARLRGGNPDQQKKNMKSKKVPKATSFFSANHCTCRSIPDTVYCMQFYSEDPNGLPRGKKYD